MKIIALLLGAGLLVAAQPVPDPVPDPVPETPPAPQDEGSRVVRGNPAQPGSSPWQIEIYFKANMSAAALKAGRDRLASDAEKRSYDKMEDWERNHQCGGALIDKEWALSAAHCFVDGQERLFSLPLVGVRLGNIDLDYATPMRIERIIVHGDYRRSGAKQHDIALLHLVPDTTTKPDVAAAAAPARLLSSTMRPLTPGDDLMVTGWGHTSERAAGQVRAVDGKMMRSSKVLLEGRLTLVDQAECAKVAPYRKTLNPGVLCVASGDEKAQDSCQGDSGGPLTRQRVLIGLVSTGEGCGRSGVPALYTNVACYADWIAAAKAGSPAGLVARFSLPKRGGRTVLACKPSNPRQTGRG